MTDTLGLMLFVVVHSAGLQDRDGAPDVFKAVRHRFPVSVRGRRPASIRERRIVSALDSGHYGPADDASNEAALDR